MSPEPPDFIIAGAPRCGTTWLYHVLDRHPGVYMARPLQPEPKFFLIDDFYSKGIATYRETFFASVPARAVTGEKSTNYLENPVVAERIHLYVPEVKLVFSLREPADRARSNWRWSRANSMEHLSFQEALEKEAEREATYPLKWRYSRPHSYFSRGLYAQHLRPYFDLFPHSRILCLRYEDFSVRPEEIATKLHDFLEVPARPEDGTAVGPVNLSQPAEADEATMETLRKRYVRANQDLIQLLGEGFEGWSRIEHG